MISGIVKWYSSDKGYGFILPDGGGPDAFIHVKELESSGIHNLREGQRVSYEMVLDRKTGKSKAGNLAIVPGKHA